MKSLHLTLLLAMLAVPLAQAGELDAAAAALQNKSYPDAFRLYSQAAAGGNPQAQFQLGELYFYGEGVAADDKAALGWFQKSAAQGNAEAILALERIEQRHARRAEIAWWTSSYNGADLRQGRFACAEPAIPEVSRSNSAIKQVSADFDQWRACKNGVVDQLAALLPAGKQIPSELELLMTDAELIQARQRLDRIYRTVAAQNGAAGDATVARYTAWRERTDAMVAGINEQIEQAQKQFERVANLSRPYNRPDLAAPTGPNGSYRGKLR